MYFVNMRQQNMLSYTYFIGQCKTVVQSVNLMFSYEKRKKGIRISCIDFI